MRLRRFHSIFLCIRAPDTPGKAQEEEDGRSCATPLATLLEISSRAIGVGIVLMALPPVLLLPVSYFVLKERIGWQAVMGTVLAIAGVAVLFLA